MMYVRVLLLVQYRDMDIAYQLPWRPSSYRQPPGEARRCFGDILRGTHPPLCVHRLPPVPRFKHSSLQSIC